MINVEDTAQRHTDSLAAIKLKAGRLSSESVSADRERLTADMLANVVAATYAFCTPLEGCFTKLVRSAHETLVHMARSAALSAAERAERWVIVNAMEAFVDGLSDATLRTPGSAWAKSMIAEMRGRAHDVFRDSYERDPIYERDVVDDFLVSWKSLAATPFSFEEHCLLHVAKLAILIEDDRFSFEVGEAAAAIEETLISEKSDMASSFVRALESLPQRKRSRASSARRGTRAGGKSLRAA